LARGNFSMSRYMVFRISLFPDVLKRYWAMAVFLF
jgi:hypothetical protein